MKFRYQARVRIRYELREFMETVEFNVGGSDGIDAHRIAERIMFKKFPSSTGIHCESTVCLEPDKFMVYCAVLDIEAGR